MRQTSPKRTDMRTCKKCGCYLPDGINTCLACSYNPAEEQTPSYPKIIYSPYPKYCVICEHMDSFGTKMLFCKALPTVEYCKDNFTCSQFVKRKDLTW